MGLANGGIDDLEHTDGESSCFTSTRLRLGDGVATLADLDDSSRLDGRRRLVAICVDATEEVLWIMSVLQSRLAQGDYLSGAYP